MDLDGSVGAICRRDPRFRPEAYAFLLESLDFVLARRGLPAARTPAAPADPAASSRAGSAPPPPANVSGRDLLEGFRDLALERYGALAREVVRTWGVVKTADVGAVVFNMVDAGLLQRTSSDTPADYDDVFDFEEAFDRAFADRLRSGAVRLADRPTP